MTLYPQSHSILRKKNSHENIQCHNWYFLLHYKEVCYIIFRYEVIFPVHHHILYHYMMHPKIWAILNMDLKFKMHAVYRWCLFSKNVQYSQNWNQQQVIPLLYSACSELLIICNVLPQSVWLGWVKGQQQLCLKATSLNLSILHTRHTV